jgi:nuclear pore complex protein Nup160
LLVSLFVLAEIGGAGDDEESEAIVSIVDTAFTVYHRYSVLKWLCEQSGEEARIRQKTGKRSTMDDSAPGQSGTRADEVDPTYSLIHALLSVNQVTAPQSGFNLLFDASEAYLIRLDLIDPETPQIEPREQDITLAFSVLTQGHADTARRFTELYPLSYGTAYVRGRALVELGSFNEAVDLLKQASTGCQGRYFAVSSWNCDTDNRVDGSLGCILPFTSSANGEADYYAHVSSLFGDAGYDGPAIYFGQLALRTSTVSTPPKSLHTRIFLSNISLGNYEDAYSVLTATASEEL